MGGHRHRSQNFSGLLLLLKYTLCEYFSFCTKTFGSFKATITKIYGTIHRKTVRIAKRNIQKALNGPVRRQKALEQETQRKGKEETRRQGKVI